MPLLPPETCLFPDDLFDRPAVEPAVPGQWWALHTRPRAEKALARKFLARRLAFYLPLHRHELRGGGRVHTSYLPLFPGYLFLHGDAEARLHALETNAVVRCLPVADQARLHADLARVHQLIASGAALMAEDRLRPGTRVEIVRGALAGMEGTVLREGKRLRFLVEVQFLHQGVSVEVDRSMIQPLEGAGERPGVAAGS